MLDIPKVPSQGSPEATAAVLLRRYQAGDNEAGKELIELLDSYFRERLRPILLNKFGGSGKNTTIRYTAMVNEFFTLILQRSPSCFRARSLRDLLNLAALVISRDMLNVLRARGRRTELELAYYRQVVKPQSDHFTKDSKLDFQRVLLLLEEWRTRPEPWPLRQRVVTNFYIIGMDYDELAVMEDLPKRTPRGSAGPSIYKIMERAMAALRSELGAAGGVDP